MKNFEVRPTDRPDTFLQKLSEKILSSDEAKKIRGVVLK